MNKIEDSRINIWINNIFETESADNLHYAFIQLIYEVEAIVKHNSQTSVLSILNNLENYEATFAYEEKLLKELGLEDLNHHISQHLLFSTRIKEFKQEYFYNNQYVTINILSFLKKWLISHILKEDRIYRDKIHEQRQ